jgi:UDPglucose 6-dehydrogenase
MSEATKPTVTIIGCGYVGLTTAAILANCGHKVYALEPLAERLNIIKSGKSFFYEAGVDELIGAALQASSLVPTDSYQEAIQAADIIFCCMGTPDNPDGSSNLTYVFDAVEESAKFIKNSAIFVQKSTVPVGTGVKIRELFSNADVEVPYVSNPEFLREGTAIIDTLWTDRIVVGSDNPVAAESVIDLYKDIEHNQEHLSRIANLTAPSNAPQTQYISMGQNSAELVKVSANAFLALKISFANSIAKLADKTNGDINQVMDAVGADKRIGRAFLNAGRGYGGGCFPKDVSGLIRSAQDFGVEMGIMNAVEELNSSMPHYIINKAESSVDDSLPFHGTNVAVLGLSFKPGTSDTRRSPAISIANSLVERGANVMAYDPKAIEEAKPELLPEVTLADSLDPAVKDAEWIFIATDWPEFVNMDLPQLAQTSKVRVIVDSMNCLDPTAVKTAGLTYIGVGLPTLERH